MLMVMQSNTGFGFAMAGSAQVTPDGSFTVNGLAPGTYNLRAQRMGGPGEGPEIAMADVTVTGDDVSDVQAGRSETIEADRADPRRSVRGGVAVSADADDRGVAPVR